MVTQLEAFKHYQEIYNEGSIYVWGFNDGTIINKDTIYQAYRYHHTPKYNKVYYQNKLNEGKGKNGSDCSGAHYLLSGYDTTADGYYRLCKKKGKIDTLPKDKCCLLFVANSEGVMKHTGAYLPGVGAFHMASSARNAVIEDVSLRGWTHWGYANFISDYDTYSFDIDPQPTPPDPRKYTQDNFIEDVNKILGTDSAAAAFEKTKTISIDTNRHDDLVTPIERYMKALEYYNGAIETDAGKTPTFGEGMQKAVKQYQREIVKASKKNQDGIITKKQATWKKLLGLS